MKKSVTLSLRIGFGLSLLLLIISSVLSYTSIQKLLFNSFWVDHTGQVLQSLEKTISTMKDAETGQRGYLLTGRQEFLEPYNGSYYKALNEINKVQNLTVDNPRQQRNVKVVKSILLNRMTILKSLIDKKNGGKTVTVDDLRQGKANMDALRQAIRIMENEENRLMVLRSARLRNSASLTPALIIAAAILSFLITGFFYIRITADLSRRNHLLQDLKAQDDMTQKRIALLSNVADQIASGNYAIQFTEQERGMLGAFAFPLNKMAADLKMVFDRLSASAWMQSGIAGLNDKMVGTKNLSDLSGEVLRYCLAYTDSQAGAIYSLQGGKLHLQNSYALSNSAQQQFDLGEGLIGQSAMDGKTRLLENIDPELVTTSYILEGLNVSSMVVVPLFENRQVRGVMELLTINGFKEKQLEFLQLISHNVGIGLVGAQNRQQLKELLEELQVQTEELQLQRTEMEGINAELVGHGQQLQASEEELRVQQEELQQSNEELEERNRMINLRNAEIQQKSDEIEQSTKYKSEFMANMSHELRTPLNSILLLSRYLSENMQQNMNAEQLESAGIINQAGNGLLVLIDDLLDLSKIEAGKMELEYEQVRIEDILDHMGALFLPISREKKLEFKVETHVKNRTDLETDQVRLEQILKNLISNAIKFTNQGTVSLIVRDAANESAIEFVVTDTGIGIPSDKHGLIFEAFKQADGATNRHYGGTGLGLSISRELAKLLGGQILLESTVNKGSIFTLSVPV
ncbi:CHASE3 domain-containing protein [Mucilaginibacter jinjuensis]|uniref:histidine kinase n=1 Tax=Mucilaginibacter jinjuensis TaxID=1176721 RepID=A0ABY7TCM0_9SPHI|nr:CHASE3 domain-containing protein [Mucilaginibacter jinjuensis]WCT13377.1 CHASE3 domain-containing protein [Mucilaginibacter jinjuensis]